MAQARTLHVRCTTWEQVDVFTTRKLRKGKLLSMKVPFEAVASSPVTLGLELPNQLVVAIDGIVQRASLVEGEHPPRTWIEIELTGLTDEVLARIRTMGAEAKNEAKTDPGHGDNDKTPAPVRRRAETPAPTAEQLPADERELFQHLSGELRRLRARRCMTSSVSRSMPSPSRFARAGRISFAGIIPISSRAAARRRSRISPRS